MRFLPSKVLVALILLVTFPVHQAHAAVWVTPTAAETAAYAVVRTGVRYAVPAVATSLVPRVVTVGVAGYARGALALLGPIGVVATVALTGYQIYQAVKDDPGKYPTMAPYAGTQAPLNGSNITAPNGTVYHLAFSHSDGPTGGWTPAEGDPWRYGSGEYIVGRVQLPNGSYSYIDHYTITVSADAPTPIPSPVAQPTFETGITGSDGHLKPELLNDFDNLIKKYAQTATVTPTPAAVQDVYNDYSAENVSNYQNDYNTANTTLRNTLTNNYNNAQAAANADPTNTTKAATAADAKSKLDQLNNDEAKDKLDEAKENVDAANITSSEAAAPHVLDFSPFLRLRGALGTAWPFSMLLGISNSVAALVRDPEAPTFDFPMPYEKTIHVDLAPFNPIAALCRWALGVLLTIGAAMGINKFFRGVS